MKKTPRWITSAAREAATLDVQMPWERGARRAETIEARKDAVARARARVEALQSRSAVRLTA